MISIKYIVLISLFFIILQDCAILIGNQLLFIAPFFIIGSIILLSFINYKKVLKIIAELYKYTPFKYLIWFVLFLFLTAFLHGSFNVGFKIILRTILIFGLTVLPAILFGVLFIPKVISYNKTLKIFIGSSIVILLYGVLDFFCRIVSHIKPPLYDILCSRNYFANIRGFAVNKTGEILNRASSIYFEPSFFATFIFLFLPIAYLLLKSNLHILKNKKVDYIFKVIFVSLFWICLFFTKSPVYIIFCIIYTLIFFAKDIIKFFRRKTIVFIIPFIVLALLITTIIDKSSISGGISNNIVIIRIQKAISALNNLDLLVEKEGSFATRIISTINTYQASKSVPLIGCGYGNTKEIMFKQYKKAETPLTMEIFENITQKDNVGASPNIFWSTLLQTGAIGTGLLYLFFLRTIYVAYKIRNFYLAKPRLLLESMILVAINYIVISFYWSLDSYPMMWFIFGILNSYILIYKRNLKNMKQISKEVNYETTI